MITVIVRHLGPGSHPSGSPQSIHGKNDRVFEIKKNATRVEIDMHVEWNGKPLMYTGPKDQCEAYQFAQEEFGDWAKIFADDEEFNRATAAWSGGRYIWFDKVLRHNNVCARPLTPESVEEVDGWVSVMDKHLDHVLSRDIRVWRGANLEHYQYLGKGSDRQDSNFVATSLLQRGAEKFVEQANKLNPRSGAVLIDIIVPKGTKCGLSGHPSPDNLEAEVMLPRDTPMKVTKVWTSKGIKRISMEVVQEQQEEWDANTMFDLQTLSFGVRRCVL